MPVSPTCHGLCYNTWRSDRWQHATALSCISSEIKPDISRKSWVFHTRLHSTPPLGESPSVYCHPVWYVKNRMVGRWWKNFEDIYNRLRTIPACDRQTDGRTDILPQHNPRYAYASRGKNQIIKSRFCYRCCGWGGRQVWQVWPLPLDDQQICDWWNFDC